MGIFPSYVRIRGEPMKTIVPNKNECNIEFKKRINIRLVRLINRGFIICSVRFITDSFNRYTGAIIKYKESKHD